VNDICGMRLGSRRREVHHMLAAVVGH